MRLYAGSLRKAHLNKHKDEGVRWRQGAPASLLHQGLGQLQLQALLHVEKAATHR